MALSTLTDEREALEDEIDLAAANRALEEDYANPNSGKTLDDLRRARVGLTL